MCMSANRVGMLDLVEELAQERILKNVSAVLRRGILRRLHLQGRCSG